MSELDLLIKNCHVLLPDFSVLSNACIGIHDSRIVRIDNKEMDNNNEASEIIDGSGKLAMPGFVDAHTHASQQLLRGSVVDEAAKQAKPHAGSWETGQSGVGIAVCVLAKILFNRISQQFQ